MLNSRDTSLLHWKVQELLKQLIINCKKRGVEFKVISTVRDLEYQKYLYAQGRTRKGNIVTNIEKPSFHWDKVGLAFDVVPVVNGKIDWNANKEYQIIGEEGRKLGFTWGGDWKSFSDKPHFQLDGGLKSSQIIAGQRPSWFNDKPTTVKDPLLVNLQKLQSKGLISNSVSWYDWLNKDSVDGKLLSYIFINYAKYKKSPCDVSSSIKVAHANKIITDLNFYSNACIKNEPIKSEWIKIIIDRIAKNI